MPTTAATTPPTATSIHPAAADCTYESVLAHLNTFPTPMFPPGKSIDATLTDKIATLYLHPAIEALLHIRNRDLPSAHFLVRHMQCAPAYEGMWLHGILHRVEGDMDNARAWYANVQDFEAFVGFWGDDDDDDGRVSGEGKRGEEMEMEKKKMPRQSRAREFLDDVERAKNSGGQSEPGVERLRELSERELDHVLEWCVRKFGTEKVLDAQRVAWVRNSEEINEISKRMVSGAGGGYRKF